jgi:hypothetical protein
MTDRTPLPKQFEVIERLLARAKAEQDWHVVRSLNATADLIRWTMANAETLKAAASVVKHPVVQAGYLRHSRALRSPQFGSARQPPILLRWPIGMNLPASAPLTQGCFIPGALVENALRGELRDQLGLGHLRRERLMEIPEGRFELGQRDEALAQVAERERKEAEVKKHEAYLASLDPELRSARRLMTRNNCRAINEVEEAAIITDA